MPNLKKTGPWLGLACAVLLAQPAVAAPDAVVGTLMTKELENIPGKEALMITVDYPPGASDPIHRHDAHAFVYVLEGTIVMGVKGGKEVTLTKGQTFYEAPSDIHLVGRNASATQPAKFVVWMVKDKGVPFFTPVK
jgi:quercetin dioxygenase-like cupin family protein